MQPFFFGMRTQGEVVVNRRVNTKSYTSLHELVNGMFPPTMSTEQVILTVIFLPHLIYVLELDIIWEVLFAWNLTCRNSWYVFQQGVMKEVRDEG